MKLTQITLLLTMLSSIIPSLSNAENIYHCRDSHGRFTSCNTDASPYYNPKPENDLGPGNSRQEIETRKHNTMMAMAEQNVLDNLYSTKQHYIDQLYGKSN